MFIGHIFLEAINNLSLIWLHIKPSKCILIIRLLNINEKVVKLRRPSMAFADKEVIVKKPLLLTTFCFQY